MASINHIELLDKSILELEIRRAEEKRLLKEEINSAVDSIKPSNLLKNGIRELTESPELKGNLLGYAVGAGTGYLTKKIMFGASHNPLKKILGSLLQIGVTNVVSKKQDLITSAGTGLLNLIFRKKKDPESIEQEKAEKRYDEALYMDA